MVDIERHEAEIRRLEEARAKLLLQLDSLVGQFEENVPAAAAVWIHQEVQRRIAEKAEQIENMGLSGVKAFKTDVEAVIEELPNQAHRSVGDRVNWPHRRGQPGSGTGPSQEGFSDRVFRDLISTLGAVLETHHLMDDPRKYPIWERVGDGKWRYAINPTVDPLLPAITTEYSKGLERLREISWKLESEKTALSQARAKDLWNQA